MSEAAIYDVADRFGVDLDQARRDHVISHILASISRRAPRRFIFYGGTALSRTWLPDARLSEDVDPVPSSSSSLSTPSGDRRGRPLSSPSSSDTPMRPRRRSTCRRQTQPGPSVFQPPPPETAWRASLGHQTILDVTAAEAADVVIAAWMRLGAELRTD